MTYYKSTLRNITEECRSNWNHTTVRN